MRGIVLIYLFLTITGCRENPVTYSEPEPKMYKYEARVCNSVGCSYYDADSVIRQDGIYTLIKDSKKITIQAPIVIIKEN